MITRLLLLAMLLPLAGLSQVQAQADGRYIEVTGTSEIEIVPDRIHYIIEIREYFEEEFDGRSKPEEYRTKISLDRIEQGLREVLHDAGISPNAVRTQEIGDYWRKQGQDFLVAKTFDITLLDFKQIDEILKRRCLKRQPSFFVMQPVYYPFLYLKYLWSSQLLLFEKSSYRNK